MSGKRYSTRSTGEFSQDGQETDHENQGGTEDEGLLDKDRGMDSVVTAGLPPTSWSKKVKRRNLLLLCLASFTVSIGQSIILPVLDDLIADLDGDRQTAAMTMVNRPPSFYSPVFFLILARN